ncbi:MAG: HEAT repeat domain-containing protein [Tepidisphaerales bacterium]
MTTSRLLELCVLMALGGAAAFAADNPAPAAKPPTTRPADPAVIALISKLGDEDFKTREAATDELRKLGQPALPALKEAATSADPEVQARARSLIKEIDNASKPKAPPADRADAVPWANGIGNGQVRVFVNGRVINGGNMRMSKTVTVVNNRKEIEVTRNQQKVRIVEDADGIKMSVTDTVDGKETTNKYEAKNAAELKEKQPEAFKIYEQSTQEDQGAGVIRPLGPGGLRLAPRPINPNNMRMQLPPEVIRELPPEIRKQFEPAPEPNAEKPATRPAKE